MKRIISSLLILIVIVSCQSRIVVPEPDDEVMEKLLNSRIENVELNQVDPTFVVRSLERSLLHDGPWLSVIVERRQPSTKVELRMKDRMFWDVLVNTAEKSNQSVELIHGVIVFASEESLAKLHSIPPLGKVEGKEAQKLLNQRVWSVLGDGCDMGFGAAVEMMIHRACQCSGVEIEDCSLKIPVAEDLQQRRQTDQFSFELSWGRTEDMIWWISYLWNVEPVVSGNTITFRPRAL